MIEYSYDPPYNHWSGNRSDTLNKWKINYKGSIATASALPEKGDFKGDTYNVLEDGSNYMWNGNSWDKLDANTYVGATSEANGIRGLVPPATTSQMYSLLTGSGIWKSGTELGLAYDNAVVHIANREVITGVKVFKNTSEGFLSGETVTDLVIRNPVINQETPAGSARSYTRVIFADAEGDTEETQAGRMGILELQSPKENDTVGALLKLRCYNYRTDSETAMSAAASFTTGYDLDEIAFATAPSTSEDRNNGTDIITRDWIPKDTRIVHSTGDETVAGAKTFSGIVYANGGIRQTDNTASLVLRGGPTNNTCPSFLMYGGESSSNAGEFRIMARINNSNSCLLTGTPDGTLSWDGQAIQTSSDERLKTSLNSVPDSVLDAWEDIDWGQFKFLDAIAKKGESARFHLGLIAQKVKTVFEEHALDACVYGILCHKEHKVTDEDSAVDLWMVRYEEALVMEAVCQRRRAERTEARIKALEDRLEVLEAKFA